MAQIGTIITSFDVWAAQLPRIEIYGTEGTLSVPDPNSFGGPVSILSLAANGQKCPTHGYSENSRGIAVADMPMRFAREENIGQMAIWLIMY